jgi:DNA processing protein
MSDLKYWIAFSKIYSIGTINLRRMLDYFGNIENAWHAAPADMVKIEGLSSLSSRTIEKFIDERNKIGDLDELHDSILNKDITVLTMNDENYPYYLKQIYDPPMVLYIKGNLDRFNQERSLAVVGSRKASHYIKEVLKKIISEFRGTDISIVSGMALGVDSAAHQAAIENKLNTIAVIGSGFDNIYPEKNKTLFKNIVEAGGAVVSEYVPTERAALWTFPRRNRIISGLSQGTLVGEAGLKSGALITAKLCLDQNRELMCIPGMVTNPNTEGTYKLIKEGAAVITNAQDILNQLNWEIKPEFLQAASNSSQENSDSSSENLTNEQKILNMLDLDPKSFDLILKETNINIDELMMALTTLELMGNVKQLPGQQFVKNL